MILRALVASSGVGLLVGIARGLAEVASHDYLSEGLRRLAIDRIAVSSTEWMAAGFLCVALLSLLYYGFLAAFSLTTKNARSAKSHALSFAIATGPGLAMIMLLNRHVLPAFRSTESILGNAAAALGVAVAAFLGGRFASRQLEALGRAFHRVLRPFSYLAAVALLSIVLILNIAAGLLAMEGPASRSNLLVITVDTLRKDRLSCCGGANHTPNIDGIAKQGILFSNAYSQMPTTLPSHAALFTGHYPMTLGLLQNGTVLADSVTTLAEILKDRGYATAGIIAGYTLVSAWGISQGFEFYDDDLIKSAGPWRATKRADAVTNAAISWLEDRGDTPFFLWVHYFDAHHPYAPPERFGVTPDAIAAADSLVLERAKYDGEVRFVDSEIGRLINMMSSAGLLANTVIVFFSDHGEGLGDHNYMRHGAILYEEQVAVPLIMVLPGVRPGGEVRDDLVESIDMVPTVLHALGVEFAGRAFEGIAVLGAAEGIDGVGGKDYILGQRRRYLSTRSAAGVDGTDIPLPVRQFFVRAGSHKLIWSDDHVELYNLQEDPHETVNLAESEPLVVDQLSRHLQAWISPAWADTVAAKKETPEEAKARLRSLGYVD